MVKPTREFLKYAPTSPFMLSKACAVFCSHESVSATTCEIWHLSGSVAYTGRVVSKSTYRVLPSVSYGYRIGFSVFAPGIAATMERYIFSAAGVAPEVH